MQSFMQNAIVLGLWAPQILAATVNPRLLVSQKPKTPIDSATYLNIAKYPAYTNAANLIPIIPDCTPPFGAVLTKYINETSTDTQAAVYVNHNDQEIILGIPGSNSTLDTIRDFTFAPVPYFSRNSTCLGCLVHIGFLQAWNSIADASIDGINDQLALYPSYQVIVAGHSLGGAIGSLAYASLTGAGLPVKAAYCSGSPRVGNPFYAAYIDKLSGNTDTKIGNYFRTTHFNDGVPNLPPVILGFLHPKGEFWESAYNATFETTFRCYGNEPADCNDSVSGLNGINNAHATYAGVRYNCRGGYFPGPPNPN